MLTNTVAEIQFSCLVVYVWHWHWCISLHVVHDQEVPANKPRERLHARRNVCCTDIIFLLLFIAFWGFLVRIRVLYTVWVLSCWDKFIFWTIIGNNDNNKNSDLHDCSRKTVLTVSWSLYAVLFVWWYHLCCFREAVSYYAVERGFQQQMQLCLIVKCACDSLVLIYVFAQLYIAVFSILHGNAKRLVYGYDSFGNICNQKHNTPVENMSLSGRDTSGLPWVFFCPFLLCILHSDCACNGDVTRNSNFRTLY